MTVGLTTKPPKYVNPLLRDYEELLFYDVEVFEENAMVLFANYNGEIVRAFSSSLDGLGAELDAGIITGVGYDGLKEFIKDRVLIGYNNHHYDDYILYAMQMKFPQKMIKKWNDVRIEQNSKAGLRTVDNETIDTFQQIHVSKPSLKRIECNLGVSIQETSVPFNVKRKLTPDENKSVFDYCAYDVKQTVNVFKMRIDDFKAKGNVVAMLPESLQQKAYKWNTTTIIGNLLEHKKRPRNIRLVPDEMLELVPVEVANMWRKMDGAVTTDYAKDSVVIKEFGNVITFGWGGLHSDVGKPIDVTGVKLADVESMYPNILILFNGLGEKTALYQSILDTRLQLKHGGKKAEQAPLKLILNRTYGILNSEYSKLNQPTLAYSICIYGQIGVYTLAKRLANVGAQIIQINTDGVMYKCDSDADELVLREWEREFSLNLSVDHFERVIQKDVNNYIAIESMEKNKVKVKGGDVNKALYDAYFANNDTRIVQIALYEHLVYGTAIQDVLLRHKNDLRLWQYTIVAGSTYMGVCPYDGDWQASIGRALNTKVNRGFAVKSGGEAFVKFKRNDEYQPDDERGWRFDKVANTSESMKIINDDVTVYNGENPHNIALDMQWYYDLVVTRVKDWVA